MIQETMQMPVGETLRLMRRQQSLTQTDLGGDQFSKSYISAVERDKIVPSFEALHFFAERLGQPRDYFEKLFLRDETNRSTSTDAQLYVYNEQLVQEKILPLLDSLLEGNEYYTIPFFSDFSLLAPDSAAHLSPDVQGRYAFLLGLIAQQKENFPTALQLLEQALVLAPGKYHPAILDALGTNYYYVQSYYVAIDYHERALTLLKELEDVEVEKNELTALIALRLKVEFHYGNDYHALGAHPQAREHFEQARLHLRSAHDMKTAGQLYLKLGYSTYADVYHRTALTSTTNAAVDETEREFQRAVSYFVQSRTLYQVSSDRLGEARARLSQTMVLLDLSTRRRQVAQDKATTTGKMPFINYAVLLDEAEEQCRQILLGWEPDATYPSTEVEITLYTALAYLIRVVAQRAAIAHLNKYTDTAERECSVAAYLCEQVVDTLVKPNFPWALIHEVATFKEGTIVSRDQTLPRIPEPALHSNVSLRQDITRSVVLFALGEVAEVLGHAATQAEYADACYERANQSFRAALDAYHLVVPVQERDRSYLYRVYQHCIDVLQERKQIRPETEEKTNSMLLDFFKDALQTLYIPAL